MKVREVVIIYTHLPAFIEICILSNPVPDTISQLISSALQIIAPLSICTLQACVRGNACQIVL